MRAPFVADAGTIRPRGGDAPEKRLLAGASSGVDHIVDIAPLVGVQLIDDRAMDVQTVEGRAFRRQWLQF